MQCISMHETGPKFNFYPIIESADNDYELWHHGQHHFSLLAMYECGPIVWTSLVVAEQGCSAHNLSRLSSSF